MHELPRPQVFLIDGYALIYRAFFAMISRPLTTSRGENTSAAWGVANFLLRVRDEYRPEYWVWVHDSGTSFRSETYPAYKATREKLGEELRDTFNYSVERVEQLLDAFGVPLVAIEGFEADDVIGTLAVKVAEQGLHAVIVSGDKDFYQLIGPHVSLLNPGRGGAAAVPEELVTTQNASDRLGVAPERVIDYLALVGDASDNVPGVRGVGDKTARKLIEDYGDLDGILSHASEIKGKRAREALEVEADSARLSRDLVTIRKSVPVDIALERFERGDADADALRVLFTDLEFHTLIEKIGGARAPAVASEQHHTTLTGVAEVEGMVGAARAAALVAVRTVGTNFHPRRSRLLGISIAVGDGRSWYVPIGDQAPLDLLAVDTRTPLPPLHAPSMKPLVDLLEDAGLPKVAHDAKQDVLLLRSIGVQLRGIVYDAMLASFLLDPGKRSHDLNVLALESFNVSVPGPEELTGKGKARREMDAISVEELGEWCCTSTDLVLRVRESQAAPLRDSGLSKLLDDVELPLVDVLADMEWRGITVDTDQLADMSRLYREELQRLEQSIYEEAGTDFNINSTPQLRHILFEKHQLPVIKKTKTGPSTDAEVLAQLAESGFAIPRLLLEYRELSKLISTYIDALPRSVDPGTGRVHTRFNQTGAATGRLSSSDPNLQNIPIRTERGGLIRRCFVPAPGGSLVVADYSQIELRVLAHLSEDPAFTGAFQRGGDIHRETAAIVFDVEVDAVTPEMRAQAKTINFATIYGQGPFALARQLGISQDEARDFITTYFERFAGVRAFLDRSIETARARGYAETLFGRRRYIPELRERNFNMRSFGERTAMNSPIQGSAADLIKIAMVNLHRRLLEDQLAGGMLLQVHDELVLEAPDAEVDPVVRIVREEMEGAASLSVPLVVDIGVGPNWLDAKK
jgi:DNA polymerase-1